MSFKFHGYSKKYIMHHVQSQRTSRSMDVVVCTWTIMDDFPLEIESFTLLGTAYTLLYLLNFGFPFIMKEIILDN